METVRYAVRRAVWLVFSQAQKNGMRRTFLPRMAVDMFKPTHLHLMDNPGQYL